MCRRVLLNLECELNEGVSQSLSGTFVDSGPVTQRCPRPAATLAAAVAAVAAMGLLAGCSPAARAASGSSSHPQASVPTSPSASPPATTPAPRHHHSHPKPRPPQRPPKPKSFQVGYTQTTYINPILGGRTLLTTIRYPTLAGANGQETTDAPPARQFGPYPVIVFAHGYNVVPDTYRALLDAWTEAGFVVVAPLFPGENEHNVSALGGPTSLAGSRAEADVYNEPYDLAFLIKMVAGNFGGGTASTGGPNAAALLRGVADARRIVLAGQSDGGDAVAALAYDTYYGNTWASIPAPNRPSAIGIFEGAEFVLGRDHYTATTTGQPPIGFVVQSATDACNPPQESTQLYDAIGQPKRFLELDNATHLGPYDGAGTDASLVEALTVGFFRRWVGDTAASAGPLWAVANTAGVSAMSEADTAPAMASLGFSTAACAP